ncbi:SICA antigen [Plasmodium coatneyi]|uniref:SICA antigen n=1 Tax=Plasmodium coatneyi TaxID=208452 RepID=A0A1B1E1Y3_9APIC|nr:SICA antigen [Plasmodium coatneyi]ANQ09018.1 SICA antigen [Plasmodium coatneyi]
MGKLLLLKMTVSILPKVQRTVANLPPEQIDHAFLPYLPTIPTTIGIITMTYLLWKYFGLPGKRERYRRAHQVPAATPREQIINHVDDQDDGLHAYALVKKRRQPRSVPTGRTKRPKKQGVDRRRGVDRRVIIDIHLEVLDECQKGDVYSTKEDYFSILVQEFMGSELIKEENVPKEQVPSSDSGF